MTGLIDANIFIHAQTRDEHAEECLRFLEALAEGQVQARLDPLVVHEISYALPRYRRGMSTAEVADYLLTILAWEGIVTPDDLIARAVRRWRDSPPVGFVDAYLAAAAAADGAPVFTKNVRHFDGQGAEIPDPLPA